MHGPVVMDDIPVYSYAIEDSIFQFSARSAQYWRSNPQGHYCYIYLTERERIILGVLQGISSRHDWRCTSSFSCYRRTQIPISSQVCKVLEEHSSKQLSYLLDASSASAVLDIEGSDTFLVYIIHLFLLQP